MDHRFGFLSFIALNAQDQLWDLLVDWFIPRAISREISLLDSEPKTDYSLRHKEQQIPEDDLRSWRRKPPRSRG